MASKKFIEWIRNTNKEMNIPTHIEELNKEDIDSLVNIALKEANPLYPVPVLMGKKELKEIYLQVSK